MPLLFETLVGKPQTKFGSAITFYPTTINFSRRSLILSSAQKMELQKLSFPGWSRTNRLPSLISTFRLSSGVKYMHTRNPMRVLLKHLTFFLHHNFTSG